MAKSNESSDAMIARLEKILKEKEILKKKKEDMKKDVETEEKMLIIYGKILLAAGYTDGLEISTVHFSLQANAKDYAKKLMNFFGTSRRNYYSRTFDSTPAIDAIGLAGSGAWNLFFKRNKFIPPQGCKVLGYPQVKTTLFT